MFPIIYSDEFLNHDTFNHPNSQEACQKISWKPQNYPENPQRLTAIKTALEKASYANQLEWLLPTPLKDRRVRPYIEKLHSASYIDKILQMAQNGGGVMDDGKTLVSSQSYKVALLAVSAWLDGIDKILEINNPTFVLARPPGHHATKDTGMGFCLFSNAAIAAYYALEKPEVKRVAILDWDVHHGNGTQALVENNPNIVYCSLHQFPHYPGTGEASDRGQYNNILNIPLPATSKRLKYKDAFYHKVIPFLKNFQPDLLIVSAGYDANKKDSASQISLHPCDYGTFTDYSLKITRRILFGLEGGYDLDSLSQSVVATIESCLT